MNTKHLARAATVGAIAVGLVAGSATAATAAPQANGSDGPIWIYDSFNWELYEKVAPESYAYDEQLYWTGSSTDLLATIPCPAESTMPYLFVTQPGTERAGRDVWQAWSENGFSPDTTNVLLPLAALQNINDGDAGPIKNNGGTWSWGLACTTNSGLDTVAVYYRTIQVTPGTGSFTVTPNDAEPQWAPDFADYAATSGATAVIRNGNLELDATAANAGKSVDVFAEGTSGKVATVTLDAQGTAIHTLPAGVANGTRLALAEGEDVVAWVAAADAPVAPPNPPEPVAGETPGEGAVTLPADSFVLDIALPANAGETLDVWAFSTPQKLGQVTLDAEGNATYDLEGTGLSGAHTIVLTLKDDLEVLGWGAVSVPEPTWPLSGQTALTATVTNTGKFALEGVAAAADLGQIKRGATTEARALGAFTVTDDRDDLKGWTLKADVADFTSGGNTIPKSALGIATRVVGGETAGITTGAAQSAGSGAYSTTLAEAAEGSTTLDTGAQLDADLTFQAPKTAKKGTYTSTLTLTLASK